MAILFCRDVILVFRMSISFWLASPSFSFALSLTSCSSNTASRFSLKVIDSSSTTASTNSVLTFSYSSSTTSVSWCFNESISLWISIGLNWNSYASDRSGFVGNLKDSRGVHRKVDIFFCFSLIDRYA